MTTLGNLESSYIRNVFFVVVRYPFDEAAVIGISAIKEFANDFKEVMLASLVYIVTLPWIQSTK